MGKKVSKILINRKDIDERVKALGKQISEDYKGKEILLVCVLRGAFIFTADLIRHIDVPVSVDFMSVSSYGDSVTSSGIVKINKDLDSEITGKHVIIVEDIVDTGLTLINLKQVLMTRNPAGLAVCAAFDKPDRRKVDVKVDYIGMEVPDEFIVGYGLDYADKYRNLPDVCILAEDGGTGK